MRQLQNGDSAVTVQKQSAQPFKPISAMSVRSARPSIDLFMLTPDDAQSEGTMRGVVVHHGINKIAFELAGLFVGDSIWHNDGNVIVFMLIGPWQRYDLCSRRRYLLHECQKRLWYGL